MGVAVNYVKGMTSSLRLPLLLLSMTLLAMSWRAEARSFGAGSPSLYEVQDLNSHHVINKRSFNRLGCLGDYDTASFSRLDRLCEDCYNLYQDVRVREMCKSRCFTTDTFDKCAQALIVDMEEEKIRDKVNRLFGRD